jgi:hypothetical protein
VESEAKELAAQADLIRCLFGSLPFRPAVIESGWLAFDGGVVPRLARGIQDEGAFDRLPILADALEEAGATDVEMLLHLRGPGLHCRGCWVVDAVLGKK